MQHFAAWRSQQEGVTWRLPTEQEWEKAAAWDPALNRYYLYGFHDDVITCSSCNYKVDSVTYCVGNATPVGYYNGTDGRNDSKSFYGCYDMSGNLREWTSSSYSYGKAIRGGDFDLTAEYCRSLSRMWHYPDVVSQALGFRLVRSLP